MPDHYEMPHPDADACVHAGVGKACLPCREVLDNLHRINLRDTGDGRALKAEGWHEGAMAEADAMNRLTPGARRIMDLMVRSTNPYREETRDDHA